MKLKRTVLGPLVVALVAIVSGGWLLQQGVTQQGGPFQQARIFDEVVQYLSSRYVDEHPKSELYEMAVEGMLRELGDPHTTFLSAEEYNNLRISTTGEYGGLGIEIAERDGWVTALAVLPGTPAERAGLLAGDRIVAVDGKSAEGWTSDDAVKVLRGPKGEPVDLRIARLGIDEPIDFRVVREEITINAVPYVFMFGDGVGYVRLRVFSEHATDELRAAVARLREQGMERLIVDLRDNPGGLLDQGISISDLFLSEGATISETRSREPLQNQSFMATGGEEFPSMPMVVLVNEYSASASEIVAGALQDNDRALVVGAPSFGKGSVQSLFPLSEGNFLKMTTGRWYTPAGRSIQKERKRTPQADGLLANEDEAIAEDGNPIRVEVDTVSREEFKTVGGRVVYGGGGIVPDVIVHPDTLTAVEQEFFKALSKAGSTYTNVLARYALEYVRATPDLSRDFGVTSEMRAELFRRLRGAGGRGDSGTVRCGPGDHRSFARL